MTQMEKEGFVFFFLQYTSEKNVSSDDLCHALPVEPERLLRWIQGKEKIDEFRLEKALRLFDSDLDTFTHLCSLAVLDT